jgi:hypothetical protein
MHALTAIEALRLRLAKSNASIEFGETPFGQPQLVESAVRVSEKLFQGYAKAIPSAENAYAAVLAYARGQKVDGRQRHMIASALSMSIRELDKQCLLGLPKLQNILESYQVDADKGRLWQLTWYGLLVSYFAYDPACAKPQDEAGWEQLRTFLNHTWPLIDRQADGALVPDWIVLLRTERQLLGDRPADKYGRAWLEGDMKMTERLRLDLDIPPSSWFWSELVTGAVRVAAGKTDAAFIASIPKLLDLIDDRPVCRDDAVEAILVRYFACRETPVHEDLCAYVVHKNVWRNPKLRDAGYATKWNRVPDEVWRMVLGWVNKQNLRDFFDILALRNKADEGRLAFWTKYIEQIHWTRLIFSSDTMELARHSEEVRALIAREDGSYASLTINKGVDAFMMQIGDFIIVEFSKKPNACYIYPISGLKFDRYRKTYTGSTGDLKYGHYDSNSGKIIHNGDWQSNGAATLRRLGILTDAQVGKLASAPDARRTTTQVRSAVPPQTEFVTARGIQPEPTRQVVNTWLPTAAPTRGERGPNSSEVAARTFAPHGARFDMALLEKTIGRFQDARIRDARRDDGTGCIWVYNPGRTRELEAWLDEGGFRWSERRVAWYFPEK